MPNKPGSHSLAEPLEAIPRQLAVLKGETVQTIKFIKFLRRNNVLESLAWAIYFFKDDSPDYAGIIRSVEGETTPYRFEALLNGDNRVSIRRFGELGSSKHAALVNSPDYSHSLSFPVGSTDLNQAAMNLARGPLSMTFSAESMHYTYNSDQNSETILSPIKRVIGETALELLQIIRS